MKWLNFCIQSKVLIKSLTSKNMPETHLIIIQCNICFASFYDIAGSDFLECVLWDILAMGDI